MQPGSPWIRGIKGIAAVTVGCALFVVSCGGGGGDGSETPVPVPQTLVYNISSITGNPLRVSESGTWNTTIDNLVVSGTYNTSSGATTSAGASRMVMTFGGSLAGHDPLQTWVQTSLQFLLGKMPTVGEHWVRYSGIAEARMTVDDAIPGVAVGNYANGGMMEGPASFAWDPFLDAGLDPLAPAYQGDASLGFQGLQFVYDQWAIGIRLLRFIDENASALEAAGSAGITESCDPGYLGAGNTVKVVWTDASGDGALGPGDTFTASFTYCFVDDPDEDIDELLEGPVSLTGYIRNDAPFALGGSLSFDNLRHHETVMVGGVPTVTEQQAVVYGGMQMFFSPP